MTDLNEKMRRGALSEFQQKTLMDWLVKKWGKGNPKGLPFCEMCKDEKATWVCGQHITAPPIFSNGAMQLGGAVYPVVAITCSSCGNTHYVNALTCGLLSRDDGMKLKPAEEKQEVSSGS